MQLYVHYWDFTTSIPELMKSLNTLCDQGKVLYLGVSNQKRDLSMNSCP